MEWTGAYVWLGSWPFWNAHSNALPWSPVGCPVPSRLPYNTLETLVGI